MPDKISNNISLNVGRRNSSFGHHTASGEKPFGQLDHLHLRPRNGYRFYERYLYVETLALD